MLLGIKNAFNSVKWSDMLHPLEHDFDVPQHLIWMVSNYLKNWVLIYETSEGLRQKEITAETAQGFIPGLDLSSVSYDGIIRIQMPEDTKLVGHADDIAARIRARDLEQFQTYFIAKVCSKQFKPESNLSIFWSISSNTKLKMIGLSRQPCSTLASNSIRSVVPSSILTLVWQIVIMFITRSRTDFVTLWTNRAYSIVSVYTTSLPYPHLAFSPLNDMFIATAIKWPWQFTFR